MGKFIDLTGQRFGKLIVIRKAEVNAKREAMWLCRCDCGNETVVSGVLLRRGNTQSCGCKKLFDLTGKRFGKLTALYRTRKKCGVSAWVCRCDCGKEKVVRTSLLVNGTAQNCGCEPYKKHGLIDTRLYGVWTGMKRRCYEISDKYYKHYGGRGITVCDEWRNDFKSFYDWAMDNGYDENAPKGKCTLDRINTNGNYEPSNCRWVDLTIQNRNKRNNRMLTFNGETLPMSVWAEKVNISEALLCGRLSNGWSVEKALTLPAHKYTRHNS